MNKKIIGLLSLILIGGLFLAPVVSAATTTDTPLKEGGAIGQKFPDEYTADDALKILPTVVGYVYGFFLVIVVLMIIISGYMFVTAGGSPEKVTTARNVLMYALIGLAVAVLAKRLIALVAKLAGTDIAV